MLLRIIERCKKIENVDHIIVGTTDRKIDNRIATLTLNSGIKLYRGDPVDVLNRYYQCAKNFGLNNIIRITGDCPVIDISISNNAVKTYLNSEYDYVRTGLTFPDGLNTEVFSIRTLARAWTDANLRSEREHVTPYIWKNPNKFKIFSIDNSIDHSDLKLSVDYAEDLNFIRLLYRKLYHRNRYFGLEMILDLLERDKKLDGARPKSNRYEGYYKSLIEDRSQHR